MKKFLFTFVAMFTMFNIAAKDFQVVEGSSSFVKNGGAVELKFNWDDATWDNRIPLKEQWKDEYDQYVKAGESAFVEGFSEKSKKLTITKDASKADYEIEVVFKKFDYYFKVMSLVPGHKHKVWADVIVKEKSTNEIVCKMLVVELSGSRDFVKFDSFLKTMRELGQKVSQAK